MVAFPIFYTKQFRILNWLYWKDYCIIWQTKFLKSTSKTASKNVWRIIKNNNPITKIKEWHTWNLSQVKTSCSGNMQLIYRKTSTQMFFNFVKIMLIQISKQINICINSRIEVNFFTFILIIYWGSEEHLFSRT